MSLMRSMIITLVLAVFGAGLGAWGGAQYVLRQMQPQQFARLFTGQIVGRNPKNHAKSGVHNPVRSDGVDTRMLRFQIASGAASATAISLSRRRV